MTWYLRYIHTYIIWKLKWKLSGRTWHCECLWETYTCWNADAFDNTWITENTGWNHCALCIHKVHFLKLLYQQTSLNLSVMAGSLKGPYLVHRKSELNAFVLHVLLGANEIAKLKWFWEVRSCRIFWVHESSSERTFHTMLLSWSVFPHFSAWQQVIPTTFVNLLRGMVELLVFEIPLLVLLTWDSGKRSGEENVRISLSLAKMICKGA